jgi:hypothetical protein
MGKLFSRSRAYDSSAAEGDGGLLETQYIEIDDSDFGADRFFDKHNGNVSDAGERDGQGKRRRAQAELRRKCFDFTHLIRCWK